MEPKNIRKAMGSNHALEERMYQAYIAPLLKSKKPSSLQYFFGEGWTAWVLGIDEEDLSNVQFVADLCDKSFKGFPTDFTQMLSFVLSESYESRVRIIEASDDLTRAQTRGEIQGIFSNQLSLYKTIFESAFKFYASIPYFYLAKTGAIKHEGTTGESYAYISAGEKFNKLSNFITSLPNGNVTDLTKGFDNRIRNAGAGHDSWMVTDEHTVKMTVTDPKSGLKKDELEYTQKEFTEIIKRCNRTFWVLRVGVAVYLENNPDVRERVELQKKHTIFEIADVTTSFAENRLLSTSDFKMDKENNILSFKIVHVPQIVGIKGQIFIGTAEAYDIIHQRERIPFLYQTLDTIKYALSFFDKENLPSIKIYIQIEDKEYGTVEYVQKELLKLFIEEGEPQIPVPSAGKIPDYECIMNLPIKVPYGMRDIIVKEMKSRGLDVSE